MLHSIVDRFWTQENDGAHPVLPEERGRARLWGVSWGRSMESGVELSSSSLSPAFLANGPSEAQVLQVSPLETRIWSLR